MHFFTNYVIRESQAKTSVHPIKKRPSEARQSGPRILGAKPNITWRERVKQKRVFIQSKKAERSEAKRP